MPANLGTESVTVQHPLTRYAGQAGWTIVPKEEATTLRRGESGLFFYDLLKQKLQDLNPGVVTPERADDVIHRLESVRNNIEGNSEILAWLRGERSLYIESEKRTRNITLINYADATKNAFHVTEEWQYTNGSHTNRADDVFLINGIPIAVVEAKNAKKHNAMEAWRRFPKMFGLARTLALPAFGEIEPTRLLAVDDLFAVVQDTFPISPGHTLIIARRPVARFQELTSAEKARLLVWIDWTQQHLASHLTSAPDAFNLGLNDGPAAGQTTAQLHFHVIPRYAGDVLDPRGGIRHIIPSKAAYWSKPESL